MSAGPKRDPGKERSGLDSPRSGRRGFYIVLAVCAVVTLADLFYHKHGHYGWEELFGFHGGYGFVSCVLLVLAARELRKLIMRGEDYYD